MGKKRVFIRGGKDDNALGERVQLTCLSLVEMNGEVDYGVRATSLLGKAGKTDEIDLIKWLWVNKEVHDCFVFTYRNNINE